MRAKSGKKRPPQGEMRERRWEGGREKKRQKVTPFVEQKAAKSDPQNLSSYRT